MPEIGQLSFEECLKDLDIRGPSLSGHLDSPQTYHRLPSFLGEGQTRERCPGYPSHLRKRCFVCSSSAYYRCLTSVIRPGRGHKISSLNQVSGLESFVTLLEEEGHKLRESLALREKHICFLEGKKRNLSNQIEL